VKYAASHHQASREYDIEYRIIHPDGSLRYIHDRAFPIRDDTGKIYRIAGTAQDITARKEQEAHIQYLAYHDALTGLPNRALVMNRLDHALAQAHRHQEMLAVLFLDLDRFKTINDTLGHPAGDSLLQQVAVCLAETLREEDTVGRVGGDEFLILLPGLTAPEDAAHVADKILESLSLPFKVAAYKLHVRASIGISVHPRDADNAETLVKYADTALYLAKEQGRNTFRFFSPELDASVRARLHLENDLRSAIDKNQLSLLYQPLMDLDSGQCTGAEALLRWQHPELGPVSPDDFIPVAEETGLIIPIGEWVLRCACLQARTWQDAGRENFRVSVNLSRRQLEQADLAASLEQILRETGCPPQLLELEITESSTMNDPEQAIVRLQALNEMGIGLALDDYGTGYSSLAYLKRFPLNRLKIDRSFVEGIPEDSDDIAIVQTTIVLARQLRLKVVAEGVETQAQRAFLEAFGCDEIQGYLFAKPMAPDEVEKHCGFGLCAGTD
jgi:diguanylate cyclase (GGDEF)-like protein